MYRTLCIAALSLAAFALAARQAPAQDKAPAANGKPSPSQETVRSADPRPKESAPAPRPAEAREVKVRVEDLPSTVRRTLDRESYGGKVLEVEREIKAGRTLFEADVRLDGSTYEVLIAADGKLLSKTLDDDDDDDDDDGNIAAKGAVKRS